MPKIKFHVSESTAHKIHQRAQMAGVSTSRYLAELVQTAISKDWPQGFFEATIGSWQGEPLPRPPQGELEEREPLWPLTTNNTSEERD